jgi:transcriptional regulator with PAS, ATPase and Fis domain
VLRARDRRSDAGINSSTTNHLPRTFEDLVALASRNPDAPVLLQGETGTGKGYIARQIHDCSSRADAPFVEINCASLTSTFFESELFGHERGAFTDARTAKRGLLEVAGAGTVFLDEVAEMPLEVQPKLLKVIEEHTFRRLGGTTSLRSSARLVVATNEPLAAAVEAKRFRADLYYRLQVLTILLPPLRDRTDEIGALARTLLPRGAVLGAEAEAALAAYPWPGNIRELRNTLWRASILAEGTVIAPAHLGLVTSRSEATLLAAAEPAVVSLMEAERRAVGAALRAAGGNRTRAAELLGIARSTLLEKLKRYPELG